MVKKDTPLHKAAAAGQLEKVKEMLERGAALSAPGQHGQTPLHDACQSGDPHVVQFLVDQGAALDVRNPQAERTPLHLVAEAGNAQLAVILAAANADLNAIDNNGHTPLHTAAAQGHLDVVKLLVQLDASATVQDKYGETPFFLAAAEGQTEVAAFFIQNGADPNSKNNAEFTPLHYLARYAADYKITKITITHEGQKYVVTNPRQIAEHLKRQDPFGGKFQRYLDIALQLLAAGATVDARTDHGNTPLHFSATHGPIEFIRLLLAGGANVRTADKYGLTSLHYAARAQKLEIMIALVEAGADVNARDAYGFTPLHEAAEQGRLSKVRYLLESGADPDAKLSRAFKDYRKDLTPQDIAQQRGHKHVVRLMEKLGGK